jgi:hypothetical protein
MENAKLNWHRKWASQMLMTYTQRSTKELNSDLKV